MQTNLYRIDDVLLRTGLVAAVFALLIGNAAVNQLEASGFDAVALAALLAAIACPLTLLGAGYLVRRRERLVVDLWRLIEAHGEVSVSHLCKMSSFNRNQLTSAIKRINRRGRALLVWDEVNEVIRAGPRRERSSLTHSEDCQSCGATVNIEVRTQNRDAYTCPYCNRGLDSDRINDLLSKLHLQERRDNERPDPVQAPVSVAAPTARQGSRLNLPVFILLIVLFWPGAVIYALHKYQN